MIEGIVSSSEAKIVFVKLYQFHLILYSSVLYISFKTLIF